jgi:hypothetical protein
MKSLENEILSIAPLKKVSLVLGNRSIKGDERAAGKRHYDFIYGIGSDGITPFEKVLFGKYPGDQIQLKLEAGPPTEIFGHLTCSIADMLNHIWPEHLDISIASVEPVGNRELVKAMAQTSGCLGGCECGCDC